MKKIILKDGGMGQELVRRASDEPTPLWSAFIMLKEPELVRDVHRENIESGARVITLNTYAATPERLEQHDALDHFEPLQRAAIDLAQEAREQAICEWAHEVKIAGCLPPLFASYQPERAPGFEACVDSYAEIAATQAGHVDLMLAETMSSIKEGVAAAVAAKGVGKPVWVSFTIADDGSGRLRSGETVDEALDALEEVSPDAVLLNCSRPGSIDIALPSLLERETLFAKGAYANGFESVEELKTTGTVDVLKARTDLGPQVYADRAMAWVRDGCEIIGGCCEISPAHIAALHEALRDAGYDCTLDDLDLA